MYWLDSGPHAGSYRLYCALKILVANRVNGPIQSLLNWKPPVGFIGFGSNPDETGKSWTKCARKNPFVNAYISDCSQFSVIIEINDAQLHTPAARHALYGFSIAFPVMWIWQKTGIKPNLDAYLKLWFSIVLYYLQAEESDLLPRNRKPVFLVSTGSTSQVFEDCDPNHQNNFT